MKGLNINLSSRNRRDYIGCHSHSHSLPTSENISFNKAFLIFLQVESDRRESDELTFSVLESNSPVVGELDTEHFLEFTEAVVDGCHINATRHDYEYLGLIRFVRAGASDVPGVTEWRGEEEEGYGELKC